MGPLKDRNDIFNETFTRTDDRTYVWDQLGEYSFEVPGIANFHYSKPPFPAHDRERKSSKFDFVIKDSRGSKWTQMANKCFCY